MLSTISWSQLILTFLSSQTMNYVIGATSIFLGKWCGFTLYKENKKVVMGIKCHAFRNVFSESGQMDLPKASETFSIPKSTMRRRVLGFNIMVSPWWHFVDCASCAATNNGIMIILWQVILTYFTKPGLVWGIVCVYLFEYESKNEITKYTKYFFIYIYM